jgi:hypothetical protein
VDLGRLYELPQSYSDTLKSVELLWTNDQPDEKYLYIAAHNTHKRKTSMPLAGYEPVIPASEQP